MQPCSMAASFHCLVVEWKDCEELKPKPKEQWIFVDQKREETKRRTEWFAETNKCRCMRCGRGNKYLRCQENAQGKSTCQQIWEMEKSGLGGHGLVRRMYRQGEVFSAENVRAVRDREWDRN